MESGQPRVTRSVHECDILPCVRTQQRHLVRRRLHRPIAAFQPNTSNRIVRILRHYGDSPHCPCRVGHSKQTQTVASVIASGCRDVLSTHNNQKYFLRNKRLFLDVLPPLLFVTRSYNPTLKFVGPFGCSSPKGERSQACRWMRWLTSNIMVISGDILMISPEFRHSCIWVERRCGQKINTSVWHIYIRALRPPKSPEHGKRRPASLANALVGKKFWAESSNCCNAHHNTRPPALSRGLQVQVSQA